MKLKQNQVIATEGVLPYMRNGKVVWKLKRWKNLQNLVSQRPYMTDNHPNGKIITTNTKLFGTAEVKACGIGLKKLCADMAIDDNAPERAGYSIGYEYDTVEESGMFEGQHYDEVQEITRIDHIAMTDLPRNVEAIATDALITTKNFGICYETDSNIENKVNIKNIAFDSISSFSDENSQKQTEKVKVMPTDIEKLQKEIDSFRTEIAKRDAIKEVEGDSEKIIKGKDVEIDSLTKKLKKANDSIEKLNKKVQEQQLAKMNSAIDTLKAAGVDTDAFPDGVSYEYIKGRVDQLNVASDVKINEVEGDSNGNKKVLSTNDYIYKNGEWVVE